MLSSVVDTALQIHGALGYTLDTPLAAWYAEVRMQHLVDGRTRSTGGGSGATSWRRSANRGPPPRRRAATCSEPLTPGQEVRYTNYGVRAAIYLPITFPVA